MTVAAQDVQHPRGVRRVVPRHPAEQLALFAESAGGDALLNEAVKVAYVRLQFYGIFQVWQIRLDMLLEGRISGEESTACMGALHSRMMVAFAGRARVPSSLPKEYLCHYDGRPVGAETTAAMQKVLDDAHGNLNSIWRRMTPDERAAAGNRKRGDS